MSRYGPSAKKLRFVQEYVESGDQVAAAIAAGYSKNPNTVRPYACRLRQELATEIDNALRQRLRGESVKMLGVIYNLANTATSEDVRLKAAKDWLDRAGYVAIKEVHHVLHPSEALQKIERILGPDVANRMRQLYLPPAKIEASEDA